MPLPTGSPAAQPVSVARLLVPEPAPLPGSDLREVATPLARGLPHLLPLEADLTLMLVVPSGLARTWLELEPATVVAAGDPSGTPPDANEVQSAVLPARLLLRAGPTLLASAPLVAGAAQQLPDAAPRIELRVLEWRLCAGTLRGVGDFGSRLRLAWRPVGRATDAFAAPPAHPAVLAREVRR